MIGLTKAATIREEVRKSYKMTDAELLAWFNGQIADLKQEPKVSPTEIKSLRLLRDALVKETQRTKKPRKRRPSKAKV